MSGFHVKAWLAWTAAAMTLVLSVGDPATTLLVLASLVLVGAAFARGAPEGRSFVLFLKLGLAFLVARVVLFGLTGHVGPTTLFTLPRAQLPAWLGGFDLGGRVTGEVVAQHAADGLRTAAVLVCAGVLLSVVETSRVLRLLPRFLFEAGLVVSIALAFVPSMLRSAAEIRDAQRLRGHSFRGLRALRPLVVPVLAGALERSLTLAESMESRGYGRPPEGAHRAEAAARVGVLAGLCALAGAGGWFLFRGGALAALLSVAGVVSVGAGLAQLSRSVARTRYRLERIESHDVALIAVSALTAALAFAARALPAAHWAAAPSLAAPVLDARLLALALLPAAPVAIAALRDARARTPEVGAA